MDRVQMMVEVSGGVVVNIVATSEISIFLIDHDNIKHDKDGSTEDARQAMQPYLICDDEMFAEKLNEALEDYEKK